MANKPRNTFKYHFIKNGKVVHRGITTDPERRGQEHQRTFGGGRIKQVGHRTTEPAARVWEAEGGKR